MRFVILKLDMDNKVENEWLEQFSAENVDEFYFEHHVAWPIMQKRGWGAHGVSSMTHADSVRKFLALRKQGIRAHSWP